MATTNKIIAIDAPVSITAAESEGEKKSPAKFDATFYTGGLMNIAGYDLPVVIDLAGLSRGNVLVANLDHDSTKRVGNFDVTNDGKTLVAHGTATASTPARDEVVNSASDGYQWQASLEVNPSEIETLRKGKAATVNGQEIVGPAYITRKGTLKGFGFVSHGADDNTTVAIAASAASKKERKMKAEVEKWIKGRFPSIDIEAMSEEEVANWESDYEGRDGVRKQPEQKAAAGDAITREMLNAQRIESLDSITANYLSGIHASLKTTAFLANLNDVKERAVEEGWTPEKYDTELLRASVTLGRGPVTRNSGNKLSGDVLEAALCLAGGLKEPEKHYTDETLQKARDRFKNGIGLGELFHICAKDRGHDSGSYRIDLDTQRAAFGMTPQYAATGFSTFDLSGILSNSAYKFLLEGWGGGEDTWRSISDITSVRDFRQITQYRLGGTMKYEKVGPGGEIKHGTVSESSYTLQADTYGKMFAITRADYINDDLGALTAVPRELGYGAAEAFNDVFWTTFLGNTWDYTSSGTITASTALASIAAAETVFFALTKPNGEPITFNPTVMLMPNGSYRVARDAMSSSFKTGGSTTVPANNSLAGEYEVVRSAYLSNSAFSGYSAVKWYLCSVRPGFAPMQTAFLNGQQAPMIETASADFNTLGVQMRGVHDFGVNVMEERALVAGSGA